MFLTRWTGEDIVEDLIQEAIVLLLDGTRNWNPSITPNFSYCLRSIIKSINSSRYQSNKLRNQQSLEDDQIAVHSIPSPMNSERAYEQEELHQALFDLTEDNEMARKVMEEALEGFSKSQIISRLGITNTNYESAMRYIRRKGQQSLQLQEYFSKTMN